MRRVVIDVLDPRTDPEPADWQRFCRAHQAFVTWDYGLMGAESRASGGPNLLVLAREGGAIVAAVVVLIGSYRAGDRGTPGRVRGLSTVAPRWVEVHNRWLSGYPAWAFAEHLDAAARRDVLRAFERAVCRYTGPGCLGVVYRCVRPPEEAMVSGRGRLARDAMGYAELDNAFTTLEDWVASLPRNRRHSVRGQLRKIAADPDLTTAFAPARADVDPAEAAGLINAHRESFGRLTLDSRGKVTAGYLAEFLLRPEVHTLTYRTGAGRLVGLATMIDHPAHPAYQHWATVRPGDGGKQHLYFDSYARFIRHMIDNGAKSLSAGRGMLDLKAKLGFTPRPLRVVVVPRPVAG
ncbi:GNAT family N-acetyltransferase [Actinokineospora sp. HUAS TT18]|uniref:GNAT family N-acetyltransferase n=1 Tax=Actinokineospora sp. HUAS TT18 TaxID=3447451 RepID=UPI003F5230B2